MEQDKLLNPIFPYCYRYNLCSGLLLLWSTLWPCSVKGAVPNKLNLITYLLNVHYKKREILEMLDLNVDFALSYHFIIMGRKLSSVRSQKYLCWCNPLPNNRSKSSFGIWKKGILSDLIMYRMLRSQMGLTFSRTI